MNEVVRKNYKRISTKASLIVSGKLKRIKNDYMLCHLLPEKK